MATAPTEYVTWWTDRVHLLLIEGNVFDASISGRHRGARQPIWLTDYAPLCLRHMYLLTAPFVWRIILYFSTVLKTHIVAWLPYLVDGLYFTLSQTHVLTAQGKTAQTMGLVLRFPLLHLDWWSNHKAWKIQMTGIYLITTLMKVCPGYTISSPLIWGSYAMKKALRLLISTAKRCS